MHRDEHTIFRRIMASIYTSHEYEQFGLLPNALIFVCSLESAVGFQLASFQQRTSAFTEPGLRGIQFAIPAPLHLST